MGMMHSQTSVLEDDVEDDPDYSAAERSDYSEVKSSNMALDAIFAENKLMPNDIAKLTRKTINAIKPYLDIQDKVSLIYLLYDDLSAETALQYTIQLVNGAELDVLDEWITYVSLREDTWQLKLLESMSIIQHYQVLRKLGYTKQRIDERFLPTNKHTSVYILLKKKRLYRMLETFESDKMNLFLESVHRDFKLKGLEFKRFPYLEMYLMYWTSIKYISSENLDNISRALKVIEMYNEAEEFKETNQINEDILLGREVPMSSMGRNWGRSLSVASTSASCSMQEDKIVENSYPINPNLPGICLIINQENFYPEFDKKYEDLLPRTDQQLESRTGTDVDNNRLIQTFKKFNYQIIEKKDLTHLEMKAVIESTVESVKNHSSLIICILSHGLEGKVFGVNSIPIAIDTVKEIMCTKNKQNLRGKPKVLILQSCQGSHCQEADEPNYALDGPVSTTDLLVFYATIPGFAAIRDKKKGTWFIQSLCDKIENESRDSHFDDICTLVQGEVTNKRWERETSNLIMVPMKTSTFTKFFFLPRQ